MPGEVLHGDALALLPALPAGVVALAYIDPPFGTGRGFSWLGEEPSVGGEAYDDRRAGDSADYLAWLRQLLRETHRALAPQGSVLLHLDAHAIHHARLLLDEIFGPERFLNEIIWHYTGGGRSKRYFSRKHDTLLWYARGPRWTFNIDAVRVPYKPTSGYAKGGIRSRAGKLYLPHPDGTPVDDVWEIPIVNPLSPERTGYPTQKPLALLKRIIGAMTHPGDLVLDPCCGSGTTAVAAAQLGRRWMAIDSSADAVTLTRQRLDSLAGE